MEAKHKEFLQKLQHLLEDYQVTLDWECDDASDMHGVYEQKMVACFREEGKPPWVTQDVTIVDGSGIMYQDIHKLLCEN